MKRFALSALVAGMLCGVTPAAQAQTIELAFQPPRIAPQDLCRAPARDKVDDLDEGSGDEELSDRMRIAFLRGDINRLQSNDPDRWFDFIQDLISRRAQIDEEFAGNEELMARISLYIDAARLGQLERDGLVVQLRAREDLLDNNQRLILAQYYLNGIGVERDAEYARGLIRDAAYDGNANALLSLARMALQGKPVQGWDAPLDLTVTMAFGGLLGQMNQGVCGRAERIAREYLSGDVVTPNPQIAYDWYKFAADLGSARGAWRVVEYHLGADAEDKDNDEMLKYLRLAIERGIAVDEEQVAQLKSSGGVDEDEILRILGFNHSTDEGRHRPTVAPLFELSVNIDGLYPSTGSMYADYLRELTQLPSAPGWVYTALGKEVLIADGRWAGEPEARRMFEEAHSRADGEGTMLLGLMLVRYRDDQNELNRAIDLLNEALTRHGMSEAMHFLDGIYRCKANDAPHMRQALAWDRGFDASEYETVKVSATDLIALDPFKEPRTLAQIQTQALSGRIQSLANFLERVQVDPWASNRAHRVWAERTDSSDQALEQFAELEFELSTNPAERTLAIELFRRVFLNNGVTTALDLAIALTEDNAKKNEIAEEIIYLLTMAGNRGEGGSIRLKSRLLADTRTERSIYEEFAEYIEDRGDFLALVFAIPHVDRAKAADYFDRAVSLMNCGTKDVAELGEAHAKIGNSDLAFHWRQISLIIEGGHVLSKLRLSDRQMAAFNEGAAPTAQDVAQRALDDGDFSAHRRLFRLQADPDLETYDPTSAAEHLLALLQSTNGSDINWVLSNYRRSNEEVRDAVSGNFNINDVFLQASQSGDVEAKYQLGLLLRETASTPVDLISSARYLQEAAQAGNPAAMSEYGYALAYGIGVPQNMTTALEWLDQASQAGERKAKDLASLVRLSVTQ